MNTTHRFYQIIATNILGTVQFDLCALDYDYTLQMFDSLKKCVDVHEIIIMDATTGEIIALWRNIEND